VKFYAWEDAFVDKVAALRSQEAAALRVFACYTACLVTVSLGVPLIALMATFVSYGLAYRRSPSTADVFTALALFKLVALPFRAFTEGVGMVAQVKVSFRRLHDFMILPRLPLIPRGEPDSAIAIEISKGDFDWGAGSTAEGGQGDELEKDLDKELSLQSRATLRNIELSVARGSLVAVVGSVGAGKSSLLHAMLGEMQPPTGGSAIALNGSVAYAAQQPFIVGASLRENIVFGQPWEEVRYQHAIHAAALRPDLDVLPAGDLTEVGSKGINLSGGQKQRVALARAVYSQASSYLLDDVLSAVDAEVGQHIWKHLITGALAGSTRVLVTNQLGYITAAEVDEVIVLDHGEIVERGSVSALQQLPDGLYAKLRATLQQAETDEDKPEEKAEVATVQAAAPCVAKNNGPEPKGTLVHVEKRQEGAVPLSTYRSYFSAMDNTPFVLLLLSLYVFGEAMVNVQEWWLGKWSEGSYDLTYEEFIASYGAMAFFTVLLFALRSCMWAIFFVTAATSMHEKMLCRILWCPMSFFDTTPIGRILNRFAQDMGDIDQALPVSFEQSLITVARCVAIVIVTCIPQPWFLVGIGPLLVLFYFIREYFRRSSREAQRLLATASSPVYTALEQMLTGLCTIRAYAQQRRWCDDFDRKVDLSTSFAYLKLALDQWLLQRLNCLAAAVITGCGFSIVMTRDDMDPALAGLALASGLVLMQDLRFAVRHTTDVEARLNAVDRVIEYSELELEAAPTTDSDLQLPEGWPLEGAVEFRGIYLRYRQGLDLVLQGVSFCCAPAEKVGVVGRTGAGKSSLMLALFRIVEASAGSILIDGVDVATLGLQQLRSRMAIVPQDPVLFGGTVRHNLDPFGEHATHDTLLLEIIEKCGLGPAIESLEGGLEATVADGGANFSVGERQLLCMARAMLRKAKILMLDEATAAIDPHTDAAIQAAIRLHFAHCTVFTIAHRLHTIMDSDRILMLRDGTVAEFDTPETLLKDPLGTFASLARAAGITPETMTNHSNAPAIHSSGGSFI